MKFLHDKRQAGVLALLSVLLGAAALVVGSGAANASHTHCDDNGVPQDVWLDASGQALAGVGTSNNGNGDIGTWVCARPPGIDAFVGVNDTDEGTSNDKSAIVYVETCAGSTGCSYPLGDTGVVVYPDTSTNEPYDATTGTGGSAGAGGGTCVYVDGTANCPVPGTEVAGLTVNEGDAAVGYAYKLDGAWVTVGGVDVVQMPYGFGVEVGRGTNSSADTVDGLIAGQEVTEDVGGCYVSYNTDETTCS